MTKRKKYTSEFKREAVRLMESSEKPPSDLARQLGVRRNQLYKLKEQSDKRGAEGGMGLGSIDDSAEKFFFKKQEKIFRTQMPYNERSAIG